MKLVVVLKLSVLTFSAAAVAQTVAVSGGASSSALFSAISGPMMPGAVTGAPYSAEETTESVQTLADGTHITQSQGSVKYYRDSMGRTRTERTLFLPPGAPAAIARPIVTEIVDPVAGARYTFDERNKTARKMSVRFVPPPPPTPNSRAVQTPLAIRLTPGFAPAVDSASNDATRPQISHESLGTQTIEGVTAVGTRTTITYPIGSIGNDRPVTTTNEVWMSPELKQTVLTKNSDPRSGDSTTRLTNISRDEPDPSRFQVPADYEIVDDENPAMRR